MAKVDTNGACGLAAAESVNPPNSAPTRTRLSRLNQGEGTTHNVAPNQSILPLRYSILSSVLAQVKEAGATLKVGNVQGNVVLVIENASWCARHGAIWPGDCPTCQPQVSLSIEQKEAA